MKSNLFFYLLKQSILKSLEGAFLGTVLFSIIAIAGFTVVQEFPPLSEIELTPQEILFGIYALTLFICFIVAAGMTLALWLFWSFRKSKFSLKDILANCILVSFVTWISFFVLVVAPIAWAIWRDFFTRQDMLASLFDLFSFITSIGSGAWLGWRLFKEFEKQKLLVPDFFVYRWNFDGWQTHFRLLWKGGGLGLICAVSAGFIFALALGLEVSWLNNITLDFENIIFLTSVLAMFSSIPALLGGYLVAGLFYLEKLNGKLTKNSAWWQASILAAFTSFTACTVVGGLYLTNPHSISVLFVTPHIFGITTFAGISGGAAGLVLYPHI